MWFCSPQCSSNPSQGTSDFTFLLSTEHHRVLIYPPSEFRVKGWGNQENSFQWQKNAEKESIFPAHRVMGQSHSFVSEISVLGTSPPTTMTGFLIFYSKLIYLSFLYDYGWGWGVGLKAFLSLSLDSFCVVHTVLWKIRFLL